ncbi:MAG: prepilin-type N-terminal cleavage/methylation domain-containing protein [Planctomycetota bacterium]
MRARRRAAFTLVELLVVIIIIGILAAVAIPQFGDSSTDAKRSALKENLSMMRHAIEKYKLEHNDTYPGVVKTHKATEAGAAAAHTDGADAYVKQLTMYSDASGNTCAEKSDSFPYGPYIRRKLPDNPLPPAAAEDDPDSVTVVADTTPLSASDATGWKASSETGEIIADNSTYASY